MPMPSEAIDQLHQMAKSSPEGIEFRNRTGQVIGDTEETALEAGTGTNATTPDEEAT